MNATHIGQLAAATVSGALPFPEIIGRLMDEGLESYSIYLTGRCVMYLGRRGEQHIERFPGAS